MSREEEEEEVRSLLLRHKERIVLDLCETDLLAVLVKNSVLSQSEEDLILKTHLVSSAPSSVIVVKRKLSGAVSSGSSSSNHTVTSYGSGLVNEEICTSTAPLRSNNTRATSEIGDNAQIDNRSATPSLVNSKTTEGVDCTSTTPSENNCDDDINEVLKLNSNSVNDADKYEEQSVKLIEIIAKGGFSKFKQFCYAIDNECPKLIEDLFNDKEKCDVSTNKTTSSEDKLQKELESIEYIDREKENDRNRRAVSYGGLEHNVGSLPRAAPRRVSLMKDPPPPPPPKPAQLEMLKNNSATPSMPIKYEQSEYNLIQNIDSNTAQYQLPNFYVNTTETANFAMTGSNNNYSSLLCHANSMQSPTSVSKREKLLHRFSDAATLGRKLKKKKNTNRTCRSMTEAIEMLADPVIEDEFFGDRTTWEYHTVSVTRVPGYGFGIAVSGGRDNPHFANGDPSIAVSDVLKGGPAEDRLQVNDRIISVNGVSLENVEYATAVQVLRDSGNTVALVVKRRVTISSTAQSHSSHVMTSVGGAPTNTVQTATAMSQPNTLNTSLVQNHSAQPIKVTLSRGNKKDDYGVVLGCRLFIKEISAKARDQLTANGYSLQEGDVITRIHNTNCGDTMSLKEAKKIIDGCKERLNLVVLRDITNQAVTAMTNQLNNSTTQSNLYASHQTQISNCSNNLDDPYLSGGANYSSQNLYVQPPTRGLGNGVSNGLNDEKSNLTPRGRSRGPIMDGVSLSQLDRPVTPPNGSRTRTDEPPRPPPPRCSGTGSTEDFYSTRRQVTESDQLTHQRQSSEPRFISFQKEGSVGIRLTGGNESGIYVTAVQPGSPASLQGLTPGDKILKVNDMDMHGVTREEAVLFLLSLQDRIDLIVQYCKEDYDEVVANQRGDSFHIKTHFHCDNPSKGEMAFKAGDVFRVIDTLHNGVVGSWQVLKIGRGHQEMQRGVIPNKSRAEELATAQFNANKKEMNSNESRGNFFRRRRSTHRRSKSLSRENWDDVVFADSISKFPAYERVVLRHPGFVRPLVLFGPISDLAREKLAKDFSDKFSVPLQDDDKSNSKCRIIRLSNIRDIMDRGKHALLDITPNAVDRLNYAQLYPIVIFLKTDSKHVIKQLRHGLPKAAHKSSKKLLEQCQKLERVWSHIFSTQIVLNDEESWYRKLRDAIDLQQSGAVWMSESKFPTSTNEMIFTPHFEPPYNFPCYRPISSSVPRCSISRRNSFSLLTNQRSLTPPRPPPLSHEINYESITNTPAGELNEHTCFYKVVPILKPSSSMPGGLATKHSVMQLSSGNTSNMAVGRVTSQYHSSQPNLLSTIDNKNQENAVRHDSLSIKNITSAINGLTMNNSIDDNINNAKSDGAIYAGSTRNIGRTPHTVEPRTTAYYYNELIKKPAIFDSKLNLLNDTLIERNGVQECIPHHSADSVETAGERIINHNDQKTETYSPCMKSQNKQNNNGNDASTSINIGNTRCGRSYNDCNGNIDSSNAINNSPYGNNPKIAAQLEGKPVPTPAIRNFTITNLPSASLLKNSTLSSMHSHNINKTSYYTSTKLSKSSGESNINFGSSNERIA